MLDPLRDDMALGETEGFRYSLETYRPMAYMSLHLRSQLLPAPNAISENCTGGNGDNPGGVYIVGPSCRLRHSHTTKSGGHKQENAYRQNCQGGSEAFNAVGKGSYRIVIGRRIARTANANQRHLGRPLDCGHLYVYSVPFSDSFARVSAITFLASSSYAGETGAFASFANLPARIWTAVD
jgi:hypothetical protein